jgi:hypothetical protein
VILRDIKMENLSRRAVLKSGLMAGLLYLTGLPSFSEAKPVERKPEARTAWERAANFLK